MRVGQAQTRRQNAWGGRQPTSLLRAADTAWWAEAHPTVHRRDRLSSPHARHPRPLVADGHRDEPRARARAGARIAASLKRSAEASTRRKLALRRPAMPAPRLYTDHER